MHDTLPPKEKQAVTVRYHDSNLYHNVMTGILVTGVLHFLSKTPVDWCSKNKAIVETATCGSEYSSARIFVEQILDLRINLRH